MSIFDFLHQPCSTRAWPLRTFSPVGPSISSFYPTPRPVQHDILSQIYFMPARDAPASSTTTPMPHQTPTAQSGVPQMPLELILSFIEAACAEGDHDAHVELLRNCSLVCRSWSLGAQKMLFREVTLRSQRSSELFMNAVDRLTAHGQALGDAVKRLRVAIDHNQPSGLHQHSFALAVTMCPNLSHLELSLYGCAEPGQDIVGSPDVSRLRRPAPSFDEQTLTLLKTGSRIDSLHFDNWSENQQAIFQMLDIWPALFFLSIGGTPPRPLHNLPPPFSCALVGLRLNFQTLPSVDFMEWLLHNSTSSLQMLQFDRDPTHAVLEYLMAAHGPTLRAIALPGFTTPEVVSLLTGAVHLRELRTESPSCPIAVYKKLPRELKHLSLGLDRDTSLNVVIDMIKSRHALETVDIHLWDNGQHHALLSPLKMTCAYQGIALNLTHDLRLFRTMNSMVRPHQSLCSSRY